MPSGPLPFGDLFNASVRTTLRLWKPLFLGFGLYIAVFLVMFLIMGISVLGTIGSMPFSEGGPTPQMGAGFFVSLLVLFIVMFLLGMAWNIGTLVLAVDRAPRLRDTLKRIFPLMGRYISVALWMFIRTWVWVPAFVLVFGLLVTDPSQASLFLFLSVPAMLALGIVFGPRVLFGQVIIVREKVSGFQAVKLSEQRAMGYWGKIVGNWLLLMIIFSVIHFGLQFAFGGALTSFEDNQTNSAALAGILATGGIGFIVMVVVYPLLGLLPIVFLSDLHDTIKANPKK